jgi:hypothetical protein
MVIHHQASEHLFAIGSAALRLLATAAVLGVRAAARISSLRSPKRSA